eukprot:CAMPEP_0175042474 /NCGR_PEP_ID=MMETSP0052_2-20121109/2590_1 /TAXON_ID=51329 ORGANISM="Polytomella parva, Strain SAG 63-3" /NCGR_SAMPLE_ID=MMETSP0052_2 /ASSEMBLY_ACC=CAM_ASM_000194 /LENGTH=1137 /DNA_ID=CAMNT_0016305303 /DNA_START=500 /DNA_END=3910 /DNA_ORIENTATION=+
MADYILYPCLVDGSSKCNTFNGLIYGGTGKELLSLSEALRVQQLVIEKEMMLNVDSIVDGDASQQVLREQTSLTCPNTLTNIVCLHQSTLKCENVRQSYAIAAQMFRETIADEDSSPDSNFTITCLTTSEIPVDATVESILRSISKKSMNNKTQSQDVIINNNCNARTFILIPEIVSPRLPFPLRDSLSPYLRLLSPLKESSIFSPLRVALVGVLASSRSLMNLNEVDLEDILEDTGLNYACCNEMLWRPRRTVSVCPRRHEIQVLSEPFVIKEEENIIEAIKFSPAKRKESKVHSVRVPIISNGQADCIIAWTEFVLANPTSTNNGFTLSKKLSRTNAPFPGVVLSYAPAGLIPEVRAGESGSAPVLVNHLFAAKKRLEQVKDIREDLINGPYALSSNAYTVFNPVDGVHAYQHVFYLALRPHVTKYQNIYVDVRISEDEASLFRNVAEKIRIDIDESRLHESGGEVEKRRTELHQTEMSMHNKLSGVCAKSTDMLANDTIPLDVNDSEDDNSPFLPMGEPLLSSESSNESSKHDEFKSTISPSSPSLPLPLTNDNDLLKGSSNAMTIKPYHLAMLNDRERTVRYKEGIRAAVFKLLNKYNMSESQEPDSEFSIESKGSTIQVLDIGSGSGLLSLLTAKATRDYFYEDVYKDARDGKKMLKSGIYEHYLSQNDYYNESTITASKVDPFNKWIKDKIQILGCERELCLAMTAKQLISINGFRKQANCSYNDGARNDDGEKGGTNEKNDILNMENELIKIVNCFSSELTIATKGNEKTTQRSEANDQTPSNFKNSIMQKAELVVHEIFGTDPLSEGILPTMHHVMASLALPTAKFVPGSFTVIAAVASCQRLCTQMYDAPLAVKENGKVLYDLFDVSCGAKGATNDIHKEAFTGDIHDDSDDTNNDPIIARLSNLNDWIQRKVEVDLLTDFPDDFVLLSEPTAVLHFSLEKNSRNNTVCQLFHPTVVQDWDSNGNLRLNGSSTVPVAPLSLPMTMRQFAEGTAEITRQKFYSKKKQNIPSFLHKSDSCSTKFERDRTNTVGSVVESTVSHKLTSVSLDQKQTAEEALNANCIAFWFEAEMDVNGDDDSSKSCKSDNKSNHGLNIMSSAPGHTLSGHWIQNVLFIPDLITASDLKLNQW